MDVKMAMTTERNAIEKFGGEKFAQIQEIYSLFDKDNDGAIATREVIAAVRSLGYNPSEKQIRGLINEFDPEGEGMLEFATFILLLDKLKPEGDTEEEIDEAFRVFDPTGSGVISAVDFRVMLTQLGEKMTEEEADEFMQFADGGGRGEVNWRELMKDLEKK